MAKASPQERLPDAMLEGTKAFSFVLPSTCAVLALLYMSMDAIG